MISIEKGIIALALIGTMYYVGTKVGDSITKALVGRSRRTRKNT